MVSGDRTFFLELCVCVRKCPKHCTVEAGGGDDVGVEFDPPAHPCIRTALKLSLAWWGWRRGRGAGAGVALL